MRKYLAIISLLMLFLVGFLPTKGASQSIATTDSLPISRAVILTTDAQKLISIYNDIKGGDSLLRLSIEADSTYSPAYFALSELISRQRGNVDSVIFYAAKAFELDSTNKWYNDHYAQSLAIGGRFVDSRRLYQKAMEREPQNPNHYVMVAMLYNQTSEPLRAISVLDTAELRTGNNSYIAAMKRELLVATGQEQRAIDETIAQIDEQGESLESRMILSDLYATTNQDSLAIINFDKALKIDSTSVQLLSTMSQFYLDRDNLEGYFGAIKLLFKSPQEKLDRKISIFNRITTDKGFYGKNFFSINELATELYLVDPTDKRLVELYTTHLIAGGNVEEALALYKRRVADDPLEREYHTSIIEIESYRKRVDSVELYAARAIELFPDYHPFKLSLANLYSYTERYDKGITHYTEALKQIPTDSLKGAVWGLIGDNYHQMSLLHKDGSGKAKSLMRKAYKAYESSLALNASNAMVLNNYAYFLSLERRELGRALDMSGRAVALEPGSSTYLDTYAWILYELGRYDEAKKIMRQVIALDTSQSAEIQFHYAEILAALGEDFMAEVYYDKALQLGYDPQEIEEKKAKLK